MTEIYDNAKEIARKLLELETERKSIVDEQKALKEELLAIVEENAIDRLFEFQNGILVVEQKTTYKVPDGLREETEVVSKSPDKLNPDTINKYFTPNISLNKQAKKALKEGDSEISSLIIVEEGLKVKITVAE